MSDAAQSEGVIGTLLGHGFFQQVLLVLVMIIAILFVFMTLEYLYISFSTIGAKTLDLLPSTKSAENGQVIIQQNPVRYSDAKQIPWSDNEKSGIEFTYSFYMMINPSTFTGENTLHHVFHKGYPTMWPLFGPAVFVKGDSNTLRVVMNTYKNPFTYVDVDNIPIRKYFHVALICRKNSLEVYINGNLSRKMPFENTLPYQNFQNIILFSPLKYTLHKNITPCLTEDLRIQGAFNGMLSNLTYLAYAASFTEIQSLMNKGVSTKIDIKHDDVPPYLVDTYWTNSYTQQA
jgi:hypothetical protein